MTEKEILAMPADEYMNDKQLSYFKELLIKEKALCQDSLTIAVEDATDPDNISVSSADPIDRASGHDALFKSGQYSTRLNKQIRMIDIALAKIGAGEYGWCESSGEEIGLKRLMICPYARYCVDEQEALEKREKHFV